MVSRLPDTSVGLTCPRVFTIELAIKGESLYAQGAECVNAEFGAGVEGRWPIRNVGGLELCMDWGELALAWEEIVSV